MKVPFVAGGVFLVLVGIALLCVGGILPAANVKRFEEAVGSNTILEESCDDPPCGWQRFQDQYADGYDTVDYWLSHITNVDAVKSQGAAPVIRDVGPIAVKVWGMKYDITRSSDESEITWSQFDRVELDEANSCRDTVDENGVAVPATCTSVDDPVDMINPAYLGVLEKFRAAGGDSAFVPLLAPLAFGSAGFTAPTDSDGNVTEQSYFDPTSASANLLLTMALPVSLPGIMVNTFTGTMAGSDHAIASTLFREGVTSGLPATSAYFSPATLGIAAMPQGNAEKLWARSNATHSFLYCPDTAWTATCAFDEAQAQAAVLGRLIQGPNPLYTVAALQAEAAATTGITRWLVVTLSQEGGNLYDTVGAGSVGADAAGTDTATAMAGGLVAAMIADGFEGVVDAGDQTQIKQAAMGYIGDVGTWMGGAMLAEAVNGYGALVATAFCPTRGCETAPTALTDAAYLNFADGTMSALLLFNPVFKQTAAYQASGVTLPYAPEMYGRLHPNPADTSGDLFMSLAEAKAVLDHLRGTTSLLPHLDTMMAAIASQNTTLVGFMVGGGAAGLAMAQASIPTVDSTTVAAYAPAIANGMVAAVNEQLMLIKYGAMGVVQNFGSILEGARTAPAPMFNFANSNMTDNCMMNAFILTKLSLVVQNVEFITDAGPITTTVLTNNGLAGMSSGMLDAVASYVSNDVIVTFMREYFNSDLSGPTIRATAREFVLDGYIDPVFTTVMALTGDVVAGLNMAGIIRPNNGNLGGYSAPPMAGSGLKPCTGADCYAAPTDLEIADVAPSGSGCQTQGDCASGAGGNTVAATTTINTGKTELLDKNLLLQYKGNTVVKGKCVAGCWQADTPTFAPGTSATDLTIQAGTWRYGTSTPIAIKDRATADLDKETDTPLPTSFYTWVSQMQRAVEFVYEKDVEVLGTVEARRFRLNNPEAEGAVWRGAADDQTAADKIGCLVDLTEAAVQVSALLGTPHLDDCADDYVDSPSYTIPSFTGTPEGVSLKTWIDVEPKTGFAICGAEKLGVYMKYEPALGKLLHPGYCSSNSAALVEGSEWPASEVICSEGGGMNKPYLIPQFWLRRHSCVDQEQADDLQKTFDDLNSFNGTVAYVLIVLGVLLLLFGLGLAAMGMQNAEIAATPAPAPSPTAEGPPSKA